MLFDILLLVVLILLAAFFSAAETAYTSMSLVQIERLAAEKGVRGRMVARLVKRSDLLLGTVLIGNSLANISASAFATELTIHVLGSDAIGYMTGILTLVVLIFGEVTPKRFAIIYNEPLCLHTIRLITALSYIFRPVIWVVSGVSTLLGKALGSQRRNALTLEGLLHMVNLAEHMGIVASQETRAVKNIFRFNEVTVAALMTHRTKVFSLEMSLRVGDVLGEVSARGFSRFPVYDEHPEKIEGVVDVKRIMAAIASGETDAMLREIMIRPLFLSTNRKLRGLVPQLKRERCHMAIVLDEYGGLAGIVTEEDITEEILGELQRENEEVAWEKIQALGEGSYRVMGDTPLYQINDFLGTRLSPGKYIQTLGGYLADVLDRFPAENEAISVPGAVFTIEKISHNRIVSVRCVPQLQADEASE